MLLFLIIVGMAILFVVLLVLYSRYAEPGGQTMARPDSPQYEEGFYGAHAGLNRETGEWEDRDGTSYGAIDDLFMDKDGDGIWDDFDWDGIPDERY
jgi:hypothetical protein